MGKKTIKGLRKELNKNINEEIEENRIINHRNEIENENKTENKEEEREEEENNNNNEGNIKRKRVRKRKVSTIEQEDNIITNINEPENKKIQKSSSNEENRFTNDCTIYIEGLPFDATEGQISAFFQSCGPVLSIRLPKWHDSGRLRGYGHVEFEDSESAAKALELDGHYMGKRYLKIDRPMVPRLLQQKSKDISQTTRPAGCKIIFVKNLPYDCIEQDLINSFMFCGKIANVRLAIWNHTNQLKGFGYIEFKNEQSAEIAVKKSLSSEGITVKGRPVICDYETGQPKGSFKPRFDPSKNIKKSSSQSNQENSHEE